MLADLLLFLGLAALTGYLISKRRRLRATGWGYIPVIAGLVIMTLAALVDTLIVGHLRIIDLPSIGPEYDSHLVLFGYLPGVLVVIVGVSRWLPALERLNSEIIARKEAETNLRRTELLLRDAIESFPDAFVVYDADDRIAMFNDTHRRLFGSVAELQKPGISYEELLRAQIASGQIHAARGREEAWIAERLEQHRDPQGEIIQHFADGRVIRLIEQRTQLGGVVGVRTDITDLYNARTAAEQTAKTVQVLLETAPVPLSLTRNGRLLFANRRMHELLGAKLGSLSGRLMRELMLDPDRCDQLMAAVNQDGQVNGFEAALTSNNGDEIWVTVNAAPIQYIDGPALFIGLHDISVRRAAERAIADSEERFRAIVEGISLPFSISRLDDGTYLQVNEPLRRMLGLEGEDITQYKATEFYARPQEREVYVEQLRTRNVDNMPFDMVTRDGRHVPVLISVRAIKFDGQDALLAIMIDVSKQHQAQAELLEAKRAAEAASVSKSQFLAVMSHELRTPLNAILGFSEVLKDQVFGPVGNARYIDYAADIHRSGEHLLALISEVLDLSRIEAGQLELNEDTVDPLAIARDSLRYIETRAHERGQRMCLVDNAANASLTADPRYVKQVLLNLLSNAVKFARDNTEIRLEVELQVSGGLSFHVINYGDGIAPDDLKRVLEPFAQLQNAHARKEHGTGLGLSITRHLMEAHGGLLELKSELGLSTTATATYPAARVVPAPSERASSTG